MYNTLLYSIRVPYSGDRLQANTERDPPTQENAAARRINPLLHARRNASQKTNAHLIVAPQPGNRHRQVTRNCYMGGSPRAGIINPSRAHAASHRAAVPVSIRQLPPSPPSSATARDGCAIAPGLGRRAANKHPLNKLGTGGPGTRRSWKVHAYAYQMRPHAPRAAKDSESALATWPNSPKVARAPRC